MLVLQHGTSSSPGKTGNEEDTHRLARYQAIHVTFRMRRFLEVDAS